MAAPAPPTDWRPWVGVGAALATALALNLWTGNALWTGYTLTGSAAYLILLGCVRHFGWRLPPGAVWMVGLTAAMHYIGGSLAGLHTFGGPNGLYYVFPWWDNLTHAFGSAAVALAASALLAARAPGLPTIARALLAVSVAATVGILVELYEFAQFIVFGTIDQGFYSNNMLDLYYNLLGAAVGAVGHARWHGAAVPRAAAPDPPAGAG